MRRRGDGRVECVPVTDENHLFLFGMESKNYAASYRSATWLAEDAFRIGPEKFRKYLTLY